MALAFLHDLLEVTHEVAHLVVRDGDKALYLERLMARPEVHVRSRVARRLPLYATGPGKILLAHAPDDVVRQVLAGPLPRLARNTIVDRDLLDAALVAIREPGYCISREETTDGASSVAAPVRGANGDVVAAISVVVPADRRDLPRSSRRCASRRPASPGGFGRSPPLHQTAEGKYPMTFLDRARWEGKIFTTGGWVAGSGGEYDAVEPATGNEARPGSARRPPADVHKAAEAAAQAQREWAALPYDRRAAVLRRAGQLFVEHEDEIDDWLIRESGAIRPFASFQTRAVAAEECYEAAGAGQRTRTASCCASNQPRLSMARRAPGRRGRGDRAVQRPDHPGDPGDRAGAGAGQRGGAQARPAHRGVRRRGVRPDLRGGRAARRACSTCCPAAPTSARRWSTTR